MSAGRRTTADNPPTVRRNGSRAVTAGSGRRRHTDRAGPRTPMRRGPLHEETACDGRDAGVRGTDHPRCRGRTRERHHGPRLRLAVPVRVRVRELLQQPRPREGQQRGPEVLPEVPLHAVHLQQRRQLHGLPLVPAQLPGDRALAQPRPGLPEPHQHPGVLLDRSREQRLVQLPSVIRLPPRERPGAAPASSEGSR
ncbi:conserved hypothetical protein [Streptomyces misionensis JCM 4497]